MARFLGIFHGQDKIGTNSAPGNTFFFLNRTFLDTGVPQSTLWEM